MRRVSVLLVVTAAALLLGGVTFPFSDDARAEAVLVVNSTGDSADTNLEDGVCDADGSVEGGQCTLRAAIQAANAAVGADTIQFAIPGGGVQTIELSGQLPWLSDKSGPTTIDGYTQAGSSPNTAPLASNARMMVQVEGGGDNLFGGLYIGSSGNVVRGLAFYKLRGAIWLLGPGAHDNRVEGNFLGTDAAGKYHAARRISDGDSSGVRMSQGASNNTIGGALAEDRNVISGNASHGVGLYGAGTDANVVAGNLVGLTPSGGGRLANRAVGVDINYGASYNVVGGALTGERNVISGNRREGVEVSHVSIEQPTANRVIGNFIGVSPSGERAPGYARNGRPDQNLDNVHLTDGAKDSVVAHNVIGNAYQGGVGIDGANHPHTTGNEVYGNRIGVSRGGVAIPNGAAGVRVYAGAQGSRIGPDNVIANNPVGVQVSSTGTTSNTITHNRIHGNARLGIDLGGDGLTRNDSVDSDSGPNELQNKPIISAAVTSGDTTTVKGTLNSVPDGTFLIELFSNPRGADQGAVFVGREQVTSDADGKAYFVFGSARAVHSGRTITATATGPQGNTSEFSVPKRVIPR